MKYIMDLAMFIEHGNLEMRTLEFEMKIAIYPASILISDGPFSRLAIIANEVQRYPKLYIRIDNSTPRKILENVN